MGQSIVGQCGKDKKTITLTDLPPNYITTISELIEVAPRAIVVVPVLSRERVLAVLEIASFAPLTDQQNALLHEVVTIAALNLEVLLRNLKTRELLNQARTTEDPTRPILDSSPEGSFTDITLRTKVTPR
jgi:GAF domain-containing protein